MIIIVAAFICSLGIAVYFLLLMADARKFQERLLDRRTSIIPDAREGEARLITSDCVLWMTAPFGSAESAGIGDDAPFFSPGVERPGADRAIG